MTSIAFWPKNLCFGGGSAQTLLVSASRSNPFLPVVIDDFLLPTCGATMRPCEDIAPLLLCWPGSSDPVDGRYGDVHRDVASATGPLAVPTVSAAARSGAGCKEVLVPAVVAWWMWSTNKSYMALNRSNL